MKYYISDMHFFHKNVTKEGNNFDNRPFNSLAEMHQYMKEKWNSKITNGDTVYILGDIAMRGTNEELIALVAQLKGRKVLIKGNHDDVSDMRYKNIFEEIYDYKEITDYVDQDAYKLVLSHYPILMWNGQHRGTIHLYGYTHNTYENEFYQECLRKPGDSTFNDIYYDGENHIYIDGDVLSTGVIPVLMVDTDTDSYYRITNGGCWPLTEYEE